MVGSPASAPVGGTMTSARAPGAEAAGSPLAGTVVIDMSRLQPGAFCTRFLADLGADVVKVEAPGGDTTRMWFGGETAPSAVALHRGKRSMTLDIKHPRAAEVLGRLVADADVLVESSRPGAMADLGIGYEQMSAVNPGLVWCSITGFGQIGPYRGLAGHDITYLGYAGVLSTLADLTEQPWQPPLLLGGPICGLMAASGIMAALTARARTGQGCQVDANIGDSAMWLMTEELTRAARGVPPWDLESPARRTYVCGDGRRVSVAAAEPRTWAALCRGLGLTDLGDQPGGPPDALPEAEGRIAAVFASAPAAHWVEVLGSAAVGPVNEATDLADDPHVQARGSVHTIDVDGRTDQVVSGPLRFSTGDAWAGEATPPTYSDAGADTDAVLTAAGFGADEIAALRREGAF